MSVRHTPESLCAMERILHAQIQRTRHERDRHRLRPNRRREQVPDLHLWVIPGSITGRIQPAQRERAVREAADRACAVSPFAERHHQQAVIACLHRVIPAQRADVRPAAGAVITGRHPSQRMPHKSASPACSARPDPN